jgi:amino acid transporter
LLFFSARLPLPAFQTPHGLFFAFFAFAHLARFVVASASETMEPDKSENGKRFFPSGAIFFFALLILFYAALWLVVYWLMIARA